MGKLVVRKIKDIFKKPYVQWTVVVVFFGVLIAVGMWLFLGAGSDGVGISGEELKDIRLQEEIDSLREEG